MPPRKTRTSSRAASTPEPAEPAAPTHDIKEVKEILSTVDVLKGRSADTYTRHLSLFSRDLNEPDIQKLMNNYKRLDEHIQTKTAQRSGKPITVQSKKSYYIALRALSEHLHFVSAEAKAFYVKRQDEFNREALQQSGENKPPERFIEEGGLPPWSDVANLYKRFTGAAKYGVNHVLVALYTLIPPRRGDYRTLVYLDHKPNFTPRVPSKKRDRQIRNQSDNPYNYIYPDGDTYEMVLTQYKTNDRYGVYKTTLPEELATIIKGYINKFKIANDTVLFRTSNFAKKTGEPYTTVKENSWSNKVTNAFKLKYDTHTLTMGNLRHMYITSHITNDLTTNEKEAIALAMGHSIGMQERYRQHNTEGIEPAEDNDGNQSASDDDEPYYVGSNDSAPDSMPPANNMNVHNNGVFTITDEDLRRAKFEMLNAKTAYYKAKTLALQQST